ncbi:AN1-type zinc finger protein [Aulographum hederae CBS 113979]|uniref:AN1-type zinc finger protein n=1 Tax=Aulographum hederae CBS 113979 TaxID=1176131 RepID=A0A6G1H5E8_9PEZI|nr:AN1-type zinc finger protein [Aulographum hederae CBS 113979]
MRSNSISSVTSATSATSASQSSEDNMQIFVKDLSGNTIPLSVPSSTSIATLRNLLALRTNLPTSDMRLVFAGKHLSTPSSTLADNNIPRDSTLHLALPVRGSKKPTCDYKKDAKCNAQVQRIVGECGFCGGKFCSKHRLLESHQCPNLEDCKKESHERNADKLNSERTVTIKGI